MGGHDRAARCGDAVRRSGPRLGLAPAPDDVVLTLNAVTAFAGAILGISTAQYNKTKVNGGGDNA